MYRSTYSKTVSVDAPLAQKFGRPWCGAEMAPSIPHIIAAPKPSASTSSPHHGRSSLRSVWALVRYWLQTYNTYYTAKSVRFFFTTINNYSAPDWPSVMSFSIPNAPVLLSMLLRTAASLFSTASASRIDPNQLKN